MLLALVDETVTEKNKDVLWELRMGFNNRNSLQRKFLLVYLSYLNQILSVGFIMSYVKTAQKTNTETKNTQQQRSYWVLFFVSLFIFFCGVLK